MIKVSPTRTNNPFKLNRFFIFSNDLRDKNQISELYIQYTRLEETHNIGREMLDNNYLMTSGQIYLIEVRGNLNLVDKNRIDIISEGRRIISSQIKDGKGFPDRFWVNIELVREE